MPDDELVWLVEAADTETVFLPKRESTLLRKADNWPASLTHGVGQPLLVTS